MARARNIKPGFFKNEQLVELPYEDRLLFIGLWTLSDREGCLEDRPKQIKMEVFPADSVNIDKALNDLQEQGLIRRYEVNGKRYIHIPTFLKHQSPHYKEPQSTIPKPETTPPIIESKVSGSYGDDKSKNPGQTPGHTEANPSPAALIADSGLLIADSGLLIAESLQHQSQKRTAAPKRRAAAPDTGPTWEAYATAYRQRYNGHGPTINAEQRAHMARFCALVPLEEAPAIAAFYVRHNKAWYVSHQHDLKWLKTDASGLRTQWLAGQSITETQARQADKTAATGNVFSKLIAEADDLEGSGANHAQAA